MLNASCTGHLDTIFTTELPTKEGFLRPPNMDVVTAPHQVGGSMICRRATKTPTVVHTKIFYYDLGVFDYDLDCLDFELDFIYGIYKSYKYEHTNLLVPLTMLSFNHQNHNHGQMRSFSFPRDKCGHGMLLPSNTDIKITRICVLDFCRHDSYKVENYIG